MTLTIKALVIALVAGAAEACAKYNRCRCTMADGAINNTITAQAKDYIHNNISGGDFPTVADNNNTLWIKSYYPSVGYLKGVDNCDARVACIAVGATGEDSCNSPSEVI
ncbi:hypothetical protein LZ32DRAFT_617615 [Colletotrichum eremochloae]|nr:hypothetical protein LZ32DRAFT_617615 [Colletotrichum eremochloae]